jgi:hypothetical protein
MNAVIKQRWLAALRSGEYKQGQHALRSDDGDERRYCCLGVLCDLIDPTGWMSAPPGMPVPYRHGIATGMPTYDILEPTELPSAAAQKLAQMNDDGRSFEEISNWIEVNV